MNAEQDNHFLLESLSGGFADRKWHVEKQETKRFLEKISVKIFFLFLKHFFLLFFLYFKTFWVYSVESAVSDMLLILSGTQHSPLVVCRAVSKKAMKPLNT